MIIKRICCFSAPKLGALLMGAIMVACDNSKTVSTYKAALSPAVVSAASSAPTEKMPVLSWDTPTGWEKDNRDYTVQTVVFNIANTHAASQASAPATASLTILPGSGCGIAPNVNRWRQQLGLEPLPNTHAILAGAKKINTPLGTAEWYFMMDNQSEQGIFAAIIPHQGVTIFVKLMGPVPILKYHERQFIAFVSSLHAEA